MRTLGCTWDKLLGNYHKEGWRSPFTFLRCAWAFSPAALDADRGHNSWRQISILSSESAAQSLHPVWKDKSSLLGYLNGKVKAFSINFSNVSGASVSCLLRGLTQPMKELLRQGTNPCKHLTPGKYTYRYGSKSLTDNRTAIAWNSQPWQDWEQGNVFSQTRSPARSSHQKRQLPQLGLK